MTTNFDPLLSRASVDCVEPLHLHGNIAIPESLVTTIRSVGKGLPEPVKGLFRAALATSEALIVLGYSGNDRDVMQHIEDLAPSDVVWIARSTNDYALRNLSRLAAHTRLHVLIGDLEPLQSSWGVDPQTVTTIPSLTFESHPAATWGEQAEITAGALQAIDAHADSIPVLRDAMKMVLDLVNAADLAVLLAHAYNRTDDQLRAYQTADEALRCPDIRKISKCRLLAERALAALDREPPDIDQARADFTESLRIAPMVESESELYTARALHNLAYLETVAFTADGSGDLAKAADGFVAAATLKREHGDLLYLQTSLRNGAAVLRAIGDNSRASLLESEFLEIADKYSLEWSRAYLPALTAHLLLASGHPDAAAPHLHEAIRRYELLADQQMLDKLRLWQSNAPGHGLTTRP